LIWLLRAISFYKNCNINTHRYIRNIGGNQSCFEIYSNSSDYHPILTLSKSDEIYWSIAARELGLPDNAWFICVHARSDGYSQIDESIQSYRNCDIANYSSAIDEVIKKGGWVIRLGDPSMPKMSAKNCLVDYAHSNLKSDRLDIILCAKAKFIIGCSSGLACVGTVFGTPCAITNLVPVSNLWFTNKDISIPKSIIEEGALTPLSIPEILSKECANYQYADLYKSEGLTLVENTNEEILDLTLDMIEKTNHIEDTFNHKQLKKNLDRLIKESHYSYGSSATISLRYVLNLAHQQSELIKDMNFDEEI